MLIGLVVFALARVAISAAEPGCPAPQRSVEQRALPRTPWGDPDLQGAWSGADSIGVPLERGVELGTRNVLTEDEFQARRTRLLESASPDNIEATNFGAISEATRFTSRQGSLIVDPANGRRPPLTSSAQSRPQARSSFSPGEFSSVSDFGPYDRCLAFSTVPAAQPINRLEIVQAPGYVAIWTELLHDARLIPLDGRAHLGTSITTYAGDSRARWEGRTLVVETTNLNGKTSLSGNGGDRPTTQLKVIERYILAEPDRLCYEATIDDPGTWTRPWTVAFPRTRDEHGRLYEDGCHEGNYSLANILRASRAADTRTSK